MALATKADILAANTIPHEDVEVPEWGGVSVRVRGLTERQRALVTGMSLAISDAAPNDRAEAWASLQDTLVAACVVDEKNKPIFTVAEVAELDPAAVPRLLGVAQRLSGMTKSAVEDAAGNSDAAPSGDSSSD